MIEQNGFRIYDCEELSNDEYHGEEFADYISGSDIAKVLSKTPAHLEYGESKTTAAMEFGTAVHTAILEPLHFDNEYIRAISKDDYPNALSSDAAMKSWLKERGIAGYSSKKTDELVKMVHAADPGVQIWAEIKAAFDAEAKDRKQLPPADFDKIVYMRDTVRAYYPDVFRSFQPEVSIVGELYGYKVKVRVDILRLNASPATITDYKTCSDASSTKFGYHSFDLGYVEKMTLQAEVVKVAFGLNDVNVELLAQEKDVPYIPQSYYLTEDQLSYGFDRCLDALKLISVCRESGQFPAYGGGVLPLETPAWIDAKMEEESIGGIS